MSKPHRPQPLQLPKAPKIRCGGHPGDDYPEHLMPWDLACARCRTDHLHAHALKLRVARYVNVHWTSVGVSYTHHAFHGKRLVMVWYAYDPRAPTETSCAVGCGVTREEAADDAMRVLKSGKLFDPASWSASPTTPQ